MAVAVAVAVVVAVAGPHLARIFLGRQQVGVEEALPLLLGLHLKGL